MDFAKPPKDVDEQLKLLRSRGLEIRDELRARRYLQFVGYYRLAGYALPFQVDYNKNGTHQFVDGATFDDILTAYVFDRKLRLAVMDAIERIEVAAKAIISQTMSERHGAHWFMEPAHFVSHDKCQQFVAHIKREIGHEPKQAQRRTVFIRHYYDKYKTPELPASWMVFEVLSFGTVSQAYKSLTRDNQKPAAAAFKMDPKVLASWLHALSYLRNLAAHHQRLWNRVYTITPRVAKQYADELQDPTRFYAQAVVIQVLLNIISPHTRWAQRLSSLLGSYSSIDATRLGFPSSWQSRALWVPATA